MNDEGRYFRGHFVGKLVAFTPKVFTDRKKNGYKLTLTFSPIGIPSNEWFRTMFKDVENTIEFELYPHRSSGKYSEFSIGDVDYMFHPINILR